MKTQNMPDTLERVLENSNITDRFLSRGWCPYFPDRESITHVFSSTRMDPAAYEMIISKGFRRNGLHFYQNFCPACQSCIPIRVDVQRFEPSKSQRRILRKNQDVRIIRHPVSFEEEGFFLYQKYCDQRHGIDETKQDYTRFLIESPVPTEMMRYYVQNRLIGIGWTDILSNSISSVYFAFDPDHSYRGPGVFSLLKEVELCKTLKKKWLQLGFWIKEHPKMSYKNRYKPCQLMIDGTWQEIG